MHYERKPLPKSPYCIPPAKITLKPPNIKIITNYSNIASVNSARKKIAMFGIQSAHSSRNITPEPGELKKITSNLIPNPLAPTSQQPKAFTSIF